MMDQGNPIGIVDVLSERLTGTRVRRIHVAPHIMSKSLVSVLTVESSGVVKDLGEPTILGVESTDDKTIIEFLNQIVLVIHNAQQTKWHRYHPSAQWRSPALRLSVAIWTDHDAFVCNGAEGIEFLQLQQITWHGRKTDDEFHSQRHLSATERQWGLRRVAGT